MSRWRRGIATPPFQEKRPRPSEPARCGGSRRAIGAVAPGRTPTCKPVPWLWPTATRPGRAGDPSTGRGLYRGQESNLLVPASDAWKAEGKTPAPLVRHGRERHGRAEVRGAAAE